jgi:hypothetical protein
MDFSIRLTEQELNYIGQILIERPFREVAPLIANINKQVESQKLPLKNPPCDVVETRGALPAESASK